MFYDRLEAGEKLAEKLKQFIGAKNTLVIGQVRGGVPVANVIAGKLQLPIDIIIAKKIGAPNNDELAIGAIAEDGEPILNDELIGTAGITAQYLDKKIFEVKEKIKLLGSKLRSNNKPVNLTDQTVILVDDGVATGQTILASIKYLRGKQVKKIIVAVPVIAESIIDSIKKQADELVYVEASDSFFAVSQFYEEFAQVSEEEVNDILTNCSN